MPTVTNAPPVATGVPPVAPAPLNGVRVIVVSHGFQQNYEQGFTNGLAAAGAQPVLIGSDRTDVSQLLPGVTMLNLRGSQEANRPRAAKALNLLRYHLRLMGLVAARRAWTVHVIGLLDPVLWVGIVQGLWLRMFAGRYVLTVHNIVPHDRHTVFNRAAFRLAYRIPHRLVVHTPRMAEQLVHEHGIQADKVVVMEHGIEPAKNADPMLPLSRPSGPLRLLFFGVVHRYKGLDLLLEALESDLPPFQLHIVGMCKDARLRAELQAQIDAHPRRESMRWTCRFVEEAEVPALMLEADVLLMPYRHIDQSGVLFQAFRHGLPVIASDVGSFRRYIGPRSGIIVKPDNVQALAHAINQFAMTQEQFPRGRIREQGRAFEWPVVVRALNGVYRGSASQS